MKRDLVISLVHNNSFDSLAMKTVCVCLWWIQWCFWILFIKTIKDLFINIVNCVEPKNKNNTELFIHYRTFVICISFCKSYGIYSYLLLSSIKCRATINDTHITIHIFHPSPLRNYSIFLLKLWEEIVTIWL